MSPGNRLHPGMPAVVDLEAAVVAGIAGRHVSVMLVRSLLERYELPLRKRAASPTHGAVLFETHRG